MSIMDLFKTTAPAPATPDTNTGDKSLSASPDTINADGKIAGTMENALNPLDEYKKMFDNASKSSDIKAPEFKLDATTLSTVSKSMDFTKGLDPALMENALKGDAKSLLAVIQAVGQNSYSASLEHATALTDAHLGHRTAFDQSRVDKGVRQQLTSDALSSTPNYDHPVVKAELNRVASQFAQANPDSSPQQIAKAAQKYIADLSAALVPVSTSDKNSNNSEEVDWSKYLA